ncbi:MAG: FAD-binding oxidoreductase [Proteobacteria bacterium]|nr:FAD-binding oxidoreductase [Pseudomonadota bacterium]
MSGIVETLKRDLGDRVLTDPEALAAHQRDTWVLGELRALEGTLPAPPAAVVEPESTEEVAQVLRRCREAGAAVVPFGGGSGVCGAIEPGADAIVLSTRRLTGLVAFDPVDGTARFRAGTNGLEAEERIQKEGFTIGHWPQSIALSTVGGWVATRAAGQYSTAYGNIEDLLVAVEAVLPDGRVIRTRETPRAAAGPDLRQLFLGSEGTLGVVTEVTLAVRPQPEASRGQSLHFPDFDAGLEAIRRFVQADWCPPVVRLYDGRESQRHFRPACPSGRHMLIALHEGPAARVELELEAVARVARELGGEASDPGLVDHWLETRNQVPSFRSLLDQGLIVDTIEVAATWSRIGEVYRRVLDSLGEVPSLLAASAHSSHSYRTGTNLYFTFVAKPDDPTERANVYRDCWRRTLEATHAAGGGIAHHHGVGRVRRARLADELGETGVSLLRELKAALDPDGLLNPGNLLPDVDAPRSS